MFQVRSLKTLAAVAGLAVAMGVSGASAATCNSPSAPNVTYTLNQGSPDQVLAHACFDGNDTNTISASFSLFGETGWILAAKSDGPDGDGALTFSNAPTNGEASPGLWAILNPSNLKHIVITLKQSSSFAAFELNADELLAGTWFTAGPGGSTMGLSHASIYYRGKPGNGDTPDPIPLPAAGWLLLTALGGLGVSGLRRRRKDA